MSAGPLFEWAAGRGAVGAREPSAIDAQIPGLFTVEGRECHCMLHLSMDCGFWSVDVRDRSGAQLQGFDGVSFERVLREVRSAGVTFDEGDARRVGRSLAGEGS